MPVMADLDSIDAELDELRAVPDNLDELIARYGERDRSLERIDDVLSALAAGSRPRSVPPLGATASEPPVFVPASVRPSARASSLPPAMPSRPPSRPAAPVEEPAAAPEDPAAAIDYEALFGGPETVPPKAEEPPALALELEPDDADEPDLELQAEPERGSAPSEAPGPADEATGAGEPTVVRSSDELSGLLEQAARGSDRPSSRDTHPEPLPTEVAAAADTAELDAVLGSASQGEAPTDDDDGFEMMVEEDDILEIDSDELEIVDEP